jgi:thioredoxin 1
MISRRSLLGIAAGAVAIAVFAGSQLTGGSVAPAAAAQKIAFDIPAFQAAQAAGKPILVDIRADWCHTCARQQPIISQLSSKPKFKDLVVFEVDYDRQKPIVRAFRARYQSTLIAFKGVTEVGRSIGDTRTAGIEALLDRTI